MDFPTRDRYRRAIEDLARGSAHSEIDVARAAVQIANRAEPDPQTAPDHQVLYRGDPGFDLIGQGRRAFEKKLGLSRVAERLAGSRQRDCRNFRLFSGRSIGVVVVPRPGIVGNKFGWRQRTAHPAIGIFGPVYCHRRGDHTGESRGHGSGWPRPCCPGSRFAMACR